MTDLTNKRVLITGASSGIGAACAETFAKHGAHLLICGRRSKLIKDLANKLLKTYSVKIYAFELDVRDADKVAHAFQTLPAEWQAIDVLVNNAGLAAGADKFQDAQLADWEIMLDTNIKGLLYVTRALLPGMLQRNSGHIINIGSISGHDIYPGGSVYCATKHAVKAISKGLKLDLLGSKLRVSSVDPGMVKTEFSQVRFKGDSQKAEAIYAGMTPLTPQDVADAVYYCASRPAHVNVSEMILLPVDQGSANHVHRDNC